MSRPAKYRVLFYVQHLLGIGHLRRAALLCEALLSRGNEVHMVLGGEAVPAITFAGANCHYLPSVRVRDANFTELIDNVGQPLTEAFRRTRRDRLLSLAAQIEADAIITELYPFGRRQMRFELEPLLDWARRQPRPPLLICSLRDILQQRSPQREAETLGLIERFYDRVWVHGDPSLNRLDESFSLTPRLGERLFYTGFVAPPAPRPRPRRGVVVSAGGGAVGLSLLQAAIDAWRSGALNDRPWTLIAGPNLPEAEFEVLRLALAGSGMELIRFCPRFVERLAGAELSISQAGYNTLMDVLVSRVPSVLVPFAGDGETEQISRARRLRDLGRSTLVEEQHLSGERLAQAAEQALTQSTTLPSLNLDGADRAAADLQSLLEVRPETTS